MLRSAALLLAVAAAAPALTAHTVHQKGKVFSQNSITVKPGESVTFVNDDAVVHNVFSTSQGNTFNLKAQAPGTSATASFAAEGSVDVRCAFHPTMKLNVVVKK
jgi:plastocyanin